VNFLEKFYKTPILHSIKMIDVHKPITNTGPQRPNELDITLAIEAAILDNAEKRQTLIPEKSDPHLLASKPREYVSIAGKNIYFGNPPKSTGPQRPASDFDPTTQIRLCQITHDQRGPRAVL